MTSHRRNRISTPRIQLTCAASAGTFERVENLTTGETVGLAMRQELLLRTPHRVSDPDTLMVTDCATDESGATRFRFQDAYQKHCADLTVRPTDDGLRFQLDLTAAEPIWLFEWSLSGLQLDEVIVPALGGQVLDKNMPTETTLSYKYPFWWNAQFVIGMKNGGGILLRSMDANPELKLLRVRNEATGFQLAFGCEAPAPLNAKSIHAEWYLDCFSGTWTEGVDLHRAWLEAAFALKPLDQNSDLPDWASSINFVLELWGDRKDMARPLHTFDQMIERLRAWPAHHPSDQTLVYLPGFAENGIDSNAPFYRPGPRLGGATKFKQLVEAAHEMGFRVMVHTNVLAMTFHHPLYSKFSEHQVVDAFGRPQTWGLDMDGDWLAEPYFAYINPGAQEWGDLMVETIGDLIAKFKIDAVFLDQTLLAFNVSKGPNFLDGMRNHVRRLQETFPDILFAGEGLHEHIVGATPMAQIHGIDSIADIHGMEGPKPWRRAHPVSTYLFSKYTRCVAHLLTKHPSHPMFEFQESAYEKLGVLPALVLYDADQSMDLPEVDSMIRRAKSLSNEEKHEAA